MEDLMWVIDIRHLLDETLSGPGIPRLKFKVQKLAEIITYATGREAGTSVDVQPRCWRKPQRKACPGTLEITLNPHGKQIHWICPECGDEGVLTGWDGLIWDMTGFGSKPFH
jgi:hypothetical protein